MTFSLRHASGSHLSLLPALSLSLILLLQGPVNAQLAESGSASNNTAAALLADGVEHEKSRDWIKAIQHYESAIRKFPSDSDLRRRLLISRLHYDVIRRGSDSAIESMVDSVSQAEALELYSEVLARLELSYVDRLELIEVIRGGTAYLEVALTEPSFIKTHLPNKSKQAIESFRTSIHKVTLRSAVQSPYDARNRVAEAAAVAQREIGLRPTTTILQFVMGAIGLLDPYSSFLSNAELNEVESQIEGNFVGLGIALQPHEVPLKILNVIAGGPAKESGLMAGDEIVEIGNVRCQDVGAERAADMLRGPENSHVRLLINRPGSGTRDLVIVRRRVEVPSVEGSKIMDATEGVAYIKINSFQKTTVAELDKALWELHRSGMKSLILDVRGNPGGWLDASIAVADRFLASGGIVSTRGKNGIENQNYTATRSGTWNIPLTLLIDQESASASEILAGAIRDNRRGELIGQTTYGKGSVQGLFHTKSLASGIRLTVSKFYSPNGRAISEQGVQPTFPVQEPPKVHYVAKPSYENNSKETDRVLEIALRHATGRNVAAQQKQLTHN